jgi:hypothetical protein
MWLRPWHVIIAVFSLGLVLICLGYGWGGDARELLLGLGVNLLSSIVFFILLELYWQKMKLAHGKEVDGFNYLKFARNIEKSKHVRILGTFIYPLTNHPNHEVERQALLQALTRTIRQPSFMGIQVLFLNPSSLPARSRAAERTDDSVIQRMEEALATLAEVIKQFDGEQVRNRIEVRLYSRMPSLSFFQTDNFASISFYYRDRPISEVTRYEFFMDTPIGDFVEKTFDDLWRDEKTIPLNDYLHQATPVSR